MLVSHPTSSDGGRECFETKKDSAKHHPGLDARCTFLCSSGGCVHACRPAGSSIHVAGSWSWLVGLLVGAIAPEWHELGCALSRVWRRIVFVVSLPLFFPLLFVMILSL